MSKLESVLKSIASFTRLPNLLLIIVLALVFRYRLLAPLFEPFDVSFTLNEAQYFLLIVDIILVAWLGYWLNDWFDKSIDTINKPDRLLVKHQVSPFWFSILLTVTGIICLMISIYLAEVTDNWSKLIVLPITLLLLVGYARWLKPMKFIGNVLVSLLVVTVLGVLLLSELETIESVPNQNFKIIIVTISISLFLLNLIREIVKDIEDISGDEKHEVVSLPILIGIKNTKAILRAALALSVFPLLYLGIKFAYGAMGYTLTIFAIVLTFRSFVLISAREGFRASILSKNLKLIMLAGTLLIGFLTVL